MVGDAFPMPDITSILDQLGKAKYFTHLDMASGYHQNPIHPNDIEILHSVQKKDIMNSKKCVSV